MFARCLVLWACAVNAAVASDWPQWRGDDRNGVAPNSPPLLAALPESGLTPAWRVAPLDGARGGGWGSPVIADGKLYLFVHSKALKDESKPAPKKEFPWLAEDKRGGMSAADYAEYEQKRRDEDENIASFYEFRERLHCLDAETGKTLWSNEDSSFYTRFPQSGTAAVVDGRIFVLGAGLRARAIDAATGMEVWKTRLPGEFRDEHMASSFLVTDGVAMVLAGHLFGLDVATGKILWEGDPQQTRGSHSSPVLYETDGKRYAIVNVAGEDTICVEPKTGRELWRVKTQGNLCTPVLSGDHMITLGNSRSAGLRCFKISPASAEEVWAYRRVADKGSSPVVVNGWVYAQGERRLCCVNLETGDEGWNTTLDLATPQYTSLVAADGKVFYACDGVLWCAADPSDFRLLAHAKINRAGLLATEEELRKLLKLHEVEREENGLEKSLKIFQREVSGAGPLACSSPAVVDGRLYLRLADGVACYDLRSKSSAE